MPVHPHVNPSKPDPARDEHQHGVQRPRGHQLNGLDRHDGAEDAALGQHVHADFEPAGNEKGNANRGHEAHPHIEVHQRDVKRRAQYEQGVRHDEIGQDDDEWERPLLSVPDVQITQITSAVQHPNRHGRSQGCLLYTSDAADE